MSGLQGLQSADLAVSITAIHRSKTNRKP